jgi:hypothetical protein
MVKRLPHDTQDGAVITTPKTLYANELDVETALLDPFIEGIRDFI